MFSLAILATIITATVFFVFPDSAPVIDKFVSILKYPAYGYVLFHHVRPTALRLYTHILESIITPIFRSHQRLEARRLVLGILADCFASVFRVWSLLLLDIRHPLRSLSCASRFDRSRERAVKVWWHLIERFNHLLVNSLLQLVSTSLPFVLSYAVRHLAPSTGAVIPVFGSSIATKYPLSFVTGVVTLAIPRRCITKALSSGGSIISLLACVCIVATAHLAGSPWKLKIAFWITLGLVDCYVWMTYDVSFRELHMFAKHAILAFLIGSDLINRQLPRPAVQCTLRKCVFQVLRYFFGRLCLAALKFFTRISFLALYFILRRTAWLVLGRLVVPVIRMIAFKAVCWACMVCVEGWIVSGRVGLELVVVLLAPLHSLDLLGNDKEIHKTSEALPSTFRSRSSSTTSSEEPLTTLPSPATSSGLGTLNSVRRLGLLLNAYMSESASAVTILELEAGFMNTPSMHAPPTLSTPSTPLSSAPSSPAPTTPALLSTPIQAATAGDEEDEISSLTSRLSTFSLAPELPPASKEIKQAARRSSITFEPFAPAVCPGPVTSPRKEWTYLEWERGAIASFCLSLVAPANDGLRERNLERVNAGYVVAMNMRK